MSTQTKKWYEGTNFYVAAFMVVLGFFSAVQPESVREVVDALFRGVGGIFAIREAVKSGGVDVKGWLTNGNLYNYLFAILSTFMPDAPPEWMTQLNGIVNGIVTQNYTAMLSGLAALGISVFYFIKNRKQKDLASA